MVNIKKIDNLKVRVKTETVELVAGIISTNNLSTTNLQTINIFSDNNLIINTGNDAVLTDSTVSAPSFITPFQFQSFRTDTYDTSTITGITGISRWIGGVLAPNGKIYGIPYRNTNVLIIDPLKNTYDTTTISGLSSQFTKYWGGVLAPNGKIYGIPYDSTNVLIIDTYNNTYDTSTIEGISGSLKWNGGVLSPNGKIYGIPFNSTSVIIIDPLTNTYDTTTITGLAGSGKWAGGVLGLNGKIYGIPYNSTNVLIIDPNSTISSILFTTATYNDVTKTLTCTGTTFLTSILVGDNIIITLINGQKFTGYVQTVNNNLELTFIYNLGVLSSPIVSLQKTRLADITNISGISALGAKYYGGVLAQNGNIYCIPHQQTNVGIIFPSTDTFNSTSMTGLSNVGMSFPFKYAGGVLSQNGKIYGIPYTVSNSIIIDPNTNTYDTRTISGFPQDGFLWLGGVLAQNGNIYGIPLAADRTLIIKTGLPSLTNWPLQAYFNKY